MKKMSKILLGMVLILTVYSVKAQVTEGDFFIGKWNVIVEGTPSGDSKMEVLVEEKDGEIVCFMKNETGEFSQVDRLEITNEEFTAYWNTGGYNVYLFMEKTDDNEIEGTLMDMFDATGERVVEKE